MKKVLVQDNFERQQQKNAFALGIVADSPEAVSEASRRGL
jgi:hypothetical protein